MRLLLGLGTLWMVTTSFGQELSYPPTKRIDHADVYHGVKVAVPYRWLEDDVRDSKEVAEWVEAQNKFTEAYLQSIPEREAIKKRLTELWNYEKYSAPFKVAKRYYVYSKNDGLQNQSVYYTPGHARRRAARAARSQHVVQGRHRRPDRARVQRGRQARWPTASPRPAPTGPSCASWTSTPARSSTTSCAGSSSAACRGRTTTRASSTAASPSRRRARSSRACRSTRSSTTTARHAAERGRARLRTPRRSALHRSAAASPRTASISSSTVGDGTTSRKNKVFIKDLSDAAARIQPLIDDFESVNSVIDNDGTTLLLQDRRQGPARPRRRRRPRQAGPRPLEGDHPGGRGDAGQAPASPGTCSSASYLKDARTQIKIFDLDGQVRPRSRAAGHRHGRRASAAAATRPRRSTRSPASPRRAASTATT